jgi:hypothetical protein
MISTGRQCGWKALASFLLEVLPLEFPALPSCTATPYSLYYFCRTAALGRHPCGALHYNLVQL